MESTTDTIRGICDGCSYEVKGWVEQERSVIPIDKCNMVIYECQHCPHKTGFVDLTFMDCKIKYNVNPYFVNQWIKYKNEQANANTATEQPPKPEPMNLF